MSENQNRAIALLFSLFDKSWSVPICPILSVKHFKNEASTHFFAILAVWNRKTNMICDVLYTNIDY